MKSPRQQRGASLIEVLVALLIFSLGVLGMVGLQARASQISIAAEDRTRAALLANEAAALMWTKQSVTLTAAELSGWQARVTGAMPPSGAGTVSVTAGVATITVTWKAAQAATADSSNRFQTQVVIP